jgi:hypothetical protein
VTNCEVGDGERQEQHAPGTCRYSILSDKRRHDRRPIYMITDESGLGGMKSRAVER